MLHNPRSIDICFAFKSKLEHACATLFIDIATSYLPFLIDVTLYIIADLLIIQNKVNNLSI